MKKLIILFVAIFLIIPSFSASITSFSINNISRYDFDTFDCNSITEEEYRLHCESTKLFIKNCYSNPNYCNCDYFTDSEAKEQCQIICIVYFRSIVY